MFGCIIYAGWCGNGCNFGGSAFFMLGIDISYGGSWYWVMVMNLLNWILIVLMIDFVNVVHVYVMYGAFSRCWIFGGGVGYVFEFCNGGVMWCDISVNLFDALVNDLVIWCGWLVVGMDVGVF